MLFNTAVFLFAFLPVTYAVFWALRTRQQRYLWLTVTGYVFYSFWDYRFCALMAFSTAVSYLAGRGMLRWDANPARRRLCLVVPVVADLALLGFFKYSGMLLDTVRPLADRLGMAGAIPHLRVVLPIGISFYTFHTISYIVDSYRRTIRPTENFFEFACYVSLFCQLVAGPIVRFRQIERDLDDIGIVHRKQFTDRGWSFFVIGMVKKVLVADTIAAIIDPALSSYRDLSSLGAWLVMLGYTFQLYFDFSGYSDMATGLGCLFGLRIPQNFDSPYKATSPSDFWKRWHISLSTCLRDYLYIPLGGNRSWVNRNLFLTMLLGGLWHGANWTFVVWGAFHGACLIGYKKWALRWDGLPIPVQRAGAFLLVLVGWVFFRATSVSMAGALLAKMFLPHAGTPFVGQGTLMGVLVLCGVITQVAPNSFELRHEWSPAAAMALAACFAVTVAISYSGHISPFLYFQF